eukprot:TRINITY_DN271_c1_g1_i1.p2 TRINITY_DN271_c1_g1~~TRINITY_DN271_c1_g1_i1.p2  ORF type:complete len:213 (-),score=24.52 TRINITY_DN271_c1_g1_i1:287-925(-)
MQIPTVATLQQQQDLVHHSPPLKTYRQSAQQQCKISLKTLRNCELAISWFPRFNYNAVGGGCLGYAEMQSQTSYKYNVYFDPNDVIIPDLNWSTTKILGLPLPPLIRIGIRPQKFEGWWEKASGQAEMNLVAEFDCCIADIYKSPPLLVSVPLTTEQAQGEMHSGSGRFVQQGRGRLAGITVVPKTGDLFVDTLLSLPTEALAFMEVELELL